MGRSVMTSVGACTYSGESVSANRCSTAATTALASIMAKFWPMQFLGPLEKASSALRFLGAALVVAWCRRRTAAG